MFVHPRSKTVAAFTRLALPSFIAIPTAIPSQTLFCRSSFLGCSTYSVLVQSCTKNYLAAWLTSVHRVLLDAVCDPGVVSKYSSLARLLLLPASSTMASAHSN